MLVSLLQMNCGPDKGENIAKAERMAEEAIAATNPRILALPEGWNCMGGDHAVRLSQSEILPAPGSNDPVGPAYAMLQGLARRHGIYVHGGSIGQRVGEKLMNTTLVFNPEGVEIARYSKIHLFDISTPDGLVYGESEGVIPGSEIVTCDIDGVTVGFAICYDLRFPELFRALRDKGAELIFLPSAFTLQTGKDHWHTLIRARAIETQCWFAAPAMTGFHYDGKGTQKATYGHSLLCDPWGNVVAQASDGEGFTTGRLDTAVTTKVRADIQIELHHRLPFGELS